MHALRPCTAAHAMLRLSSISAKILHKLSDSDYHRAGAHRHDMHQARIPSHAGKCLNRLTR